MGQIVQAAAYKFGDYELDPARFELRRNGNSVKVERIPMELLILLVEKDGAVVSRQEIVERLWGKDVFVDTEHGINTAIRKIRTALKEDADRPRFVQTVPGKGYRFVGEVMNEAVVASAEPEKVAATFAEVQEGVPAVTKFGSSWKTAAIVVVAIAVAVAALLGWYQRRERSRTGNIQSIAVLPLANLSGEASQDYFADGLTDELITMLARNTSLKVVSRTSVMQYKGVGRPLREVARELGADSILEGSVSRAANEVHVTVQLIRAADDSHIWAESYDREAQTVFALPAEVAASVSKKLGAANGMGKPQRYVSPEAHDAYLRGRYFWFADNYDRALEYMKQAVQLQPDYATAWAGLADAHTVRGVAGMAPALELKGEVSSAIHKALELDDSSAEAHHAAAAYYLFLEWNWKMADAELERTLELSPQLAEAHHLRSYLMFAMNRPEEALKAQQRSTELDPFARPWALGRCYLNLRQYDAAIKELQMRRDAQPKDVVTHFFLAHAYRYKGMSKESIEEMVEGFRLAQNEKAATVALQLFERGGPKAVEEWFLNKDLARARKGYMPPVALAADYAELGRKEEALSMLEAAYRERSPQLIFLQYSPEFDSLHDDPRYRKIVKDMNMSPAY